MASVVLQRIQQRATQADQVLKQLKAQLWTLKQNAMVNQCKAEEEKLSVENANLQKEVNQLKVRLVQAELKNGKKQVPLPTAATAATVAVPATATAPATKSVEPTTKPAEENKQTAKKAKKEAKPKKEPQKPVAEGPIDVSRLDMRVGFIVNASKHPDADSLYVEEVDLGEGRIRTVISGLVKHVPLDKLIKRQAVFLCNLKPAKMRGILSEAMIMCASTPEKVEIINPPEGSAIGDRIFADGYAGSPDAQLNPKKKIWEQIKPGLQINGSGEATYKGAVWRVEGKDKPCKAPTMTDSPIS
ncbi:hypothetical protein NP493_365g01010 [Ridgeia piscesae]|uniref:tRNA-binding domain-containing protein n=1 Tax=Ridgeia piscesae TaxID=27915 RepID=A0AAD9NTE6_RIDPI|nr:hypothetical protein NP493_365g01010 [Ridgeia piscesae]